MEVKNNQPPEYNVHCNYGECEILLYYDMLKAVDVDQIIVDILKKEKIIGLNKTLVEDSKLAMNPSWCRVALVSLIFNIYLFN